MKSYSNLIQCLQHKELDARYGRQLQRNFTVTDSFIERLGLYGELGQEPGSTNGRTNGLNGHTGCVNCLEWNNDGRLLASGSDDVHINIWDPIRKKQLTSIASGHQGNIFSVKFVPYSCDSQIISSAADHNVHIHDITASEILSVCSCHSGRVKRLATDWGTPHLFWSAGEDGLILQHDMRDSHTCQTAAESSARPKNVLIDLKSYMGSKAEAKCLAVNPVRSEMMAIGANDPFVRMYDRRMIKVHQSGEAEGEGGDMIQVPRGAVQYFVPGHLPTKVTEYKRKYRSLASTYVAFNSDGSELLVNLGGEQIYLFPVFQNTQKGYSWFSVPKISDFESKDQPPSNGYKNGHVNIGLETLVGSEDDGAEPPRFAKYFDKTPLPEAVAELKVQANDAFERRMYGKAIHLYNEALRICPDSPLLIGNRGAALLKRAWDGDVYAALRDCWTAISLDPDHFKAHLRLCRCLFELSRFDEATTSLTEFKEKFPLYKHTKLCKALEADLSKALKSNVSPLSSSSSDVSNISASPGLVASAPVPASPSANNNSGDADDESGPTRNFFIRFSSNSDSSNDNDTEGRPNSGMGDGAISGSYRNENRSSLTVKKLSKFHEIESEFQEQALDFTERYCGHCNTTTDIKEANFFGNYIVAGSDDGSFFIWDRKTTNIVKVLRGDESIVNCLQPHPTSCFLATSGIESIIRLWSPLGEDGKVNDRIVNDWTDVTSANQKRMNTNPFEMILVNMGYRVTPDDDPSDDARGPQDSSVQCNST